jgi:hypothetical protein
MESYEATAMATEDKPMSVLDAELKVEGPGMGKEITGDVTVETEASQL